MTVRRRLAMLSFLVLSIVAPASLVGTAAAEAAPAGPKKSTRPQCERAKFRLVVDVGHTAEVPGAMSARGVPEYEFNLALAREIERHVIAAGFRSTLVLVTGGATFAGLAARVSRANAWPADLFLSIHHDSVPVRFLETWEFAGEQRRYSDRFSGHSLFVSSENGQWEASLDFARLLGDALKARGLKYTPHYAEAYMQERRRQLLDAEAGVYRYDELIVLRKTRMPAVLLEAGSIVNRDEEAEMRRPERRSLVAAAVAQALETFCASRSQ
jgi:N-acetylmuramoyl-L-alanine amidase